jgi:hypothetical protein
MAEPLIDWSETLRFLELLGRSAESVDALVFPPKEGPGSDKGAKKLKLDSEGRQSVERTLSMPLYRFHSLGVRPNPGGSKAAEITEGTALFFEADGGLSIEAQEALPELLGLPEPTVTVWSGRRSLHTYWVAEEGEGLSPEEWRRAQERLIAAVEEVAPDAEADASIKDPSRVMRCPGSIHPATGERCRIHSASGKRYPLAALVEMLPGSLAAMEPACLELPAFVIEPNPSQRRWGALTEAAQRQADLGKATDAIKYLPPEDFTGYSQWLHVGMALHSVSPDLLGVWLTWSQGMGDLFNEEECRAKWQSFSIEKDSSIGLGSLIHWAKEYGYKPPSSADIHDPFSSGLAGMSDMSAVSTISAKALSTQERMGLLRHRVDELLVDGVSPLDRMPILREKAAELGLSVRDADLSKLIWEARRKNAPKSEALKPGDVLDFTPIPWCWDGLLMRQAANLVVALPKAGKTSIVLEAIASWYRGESFLGRPFHGPCPPVLIVGSDQPQNDWGRMLQRVGLVSEDCRLLDPVVGLFHSGCPLYLDPEGIEKITSYAKEHPGLLVVVDSYARCVAALGVSERDAEIAGPLADLQEALGPYGATIVVIHHSNKGSRNESASLASRGSTALPAACSQILHLQRLETPEGGQQSFLSGKRMLSTEGRGGAPEKLLIELDPEGRWLFKGDGDALRQEQERQRIVGSLNDRQAIALEHVEEVWEQTEGRQGVSADLLASLMELRGSDTSRVARRLLEQLRERGLVKRQTLNLGMGKGGLSNRYIPSTADIPDTEPTADNKRSPSLPGTYFEAASATPHGIEPGDAVELMMDTLGPRSGWQVVAASGVVARIQHESGEIREVPQSELLFCCPF